MSNASTTKTPREILDDRRYVEMEIRAIRGEMNQCLTLGTPTAYRTGPRLEKIPGEPDYALVGRHTNNTEGMLLQHYDGYQEALNKLLNEKSALLEMASSLIECLSDGKARAICRMYYCAGMSDDEIADQEDKDRVSINRCRNSAVDWLSINVDLKKL